MQKQQRRLTGNGREFWGLLPAAEIMIDYDQQNWTHQYDLWQHSLHTVLGVPRGIDDDMLYLAALLHDAGKAAVPDSGGTRWKTKYALLRTS